MRARHRMEIVDDKHQRSWRDALGEYIPFGVFLNGAGFLIYGVVTQELLPVGLGVVGIGAGLLIRRLLWGGLK